MNKDQIIAELIKALHEVGAHYLCHCDLERDENSGNYPSSKPNHATNRWGEAIWQEPCVYCRTHDMLVANKLIGPLWHGYSSELSIN